MTLKRPDTFYIKTYGCQMNELDTEVMAGELEGRGMSRSNDESTADLLIFNTCSIRDLAERKAMGKIGLISRNRTEKPIIGVTGCMANAKKETLFRKLPNIDFVLGTNNIHDLNNVLDDVLAGGRQTARTDQLFTHELNYLAARRDDPVKAHISIIRGCDKFCTYCVVPYTRGPEVSRPPEHIVEECQQLAAKGYREITLLGQNVNSYGKDRPDWGCLFHDLIYRLDRIPGIARIRFMTSHPVDITRELMEAVRDLPSLCEFVHFPMQAGSNRILKKMHRIYTIEEYLEKVHLLREIVPNVALGTDIIVGFPTESDEDFDETYRLMEEIRFSVGFLYSFSPRKGTPAMRWKDDVPETVKAERLHKLQQLQETICREERQTCIGTDVEVLVEKALEDNPAMLKGRTRCWKNVIFPAPASLIGTLQTITIHSFTHQTLIGEIRQPL